MLRATLNVNKKVEIKNYPSLIAKESQSDSFQRNPACLQS
jgi:hypothetical protein